MVWQDLASSQRIIEMKTAINLLDRWQQSTYQLPTLENEAAFYQEKERISALLVDNHLGKLARKVRIMGNNGGLDSPIFLNEWAEITFFTLLWQRFEDLSDGLKLNLIYQSGANINKKHLASVKPIQDQFMVVGQVQAVEDQLVRRSVYFYGVSTNRFYELIEYSFNQRPFEVLYDLGDVYNGFAVLYPFPGSLRISPQAWNKVLGGDVLIDTKNPLSMREILNSYRLALKVNPFCEPFPVRMEVSCCWKNKEWLVSDSEGAKIIMEDMDEELASTFYSASFHRKILIYALCSRNGLFPLSYFNGHYLVEFGR